MYCYITHVTCAASIAISTYQQTLAVHAPHDTTPPPPFQRYACHPFDPRRCPQAAPPAHALVDVETVRKVAEHNPVLPTLSTHIVLHILPSITKHCSALRLCSLFSGRPSYRQRIRGADPVASPACPGGCRGIAHGLHRAYFGVHRECATGVRVHAMPRRP